MRKYLLLFVLLATCHWMSAQQENQYTQFMFNKLVLNPAYAGSKEIPSLTLLYRNQWMGFDGSPESKLISFDAPLIKNKVGFGLSVANNTVGVMDTWYASMAYSYKVQFTPDMAIRFGLHATIQYLGIDFNDPDVLIRDGNDPSIELAGGDQVNQYKGNFGIGAYLTYNRFYFGLSVPRLYPNEIGLNDENLITAEEDPHFYAMSGIQLPLSERVDIKPSVLAKYVSNAPFDLDFNVSLIFDNKLHTGVSYRLGGDDVGESVDFLVFYQISNQVGLGAAYDFTLTDIKDHTSGSIEALLRINLVKERLDIANPRYFD